MDNFVKSILLDIISTIITEDTPCCQRDLNPNGMRETTYFNPRQIYNYSEIATQTSQSLLGHFSDSIVQTSQSLLGSFEPVRTLPHEDQVVPISASLKNKTRKTLVPQAETVIKVRRIGLSKKARMNPLHNVRN